MKKQVVPTSLIRLVIGGLFLFALTFAFTIKAKNIGIATGAVVAGAPAGGLGLGLFAIAGLFIALFFIYYFKHKAGQ